MLRIAIATLGCKTNAYESAAIAGGFDPAEFRVVSFDGEADIYIINTCTVTGRTDYKSRNLIRKALSRKEQNPSVRVVVTGCFAQRNPDSIRVLGPIDLIADNQSKANIAELLNQAEYSFQDIMGSRDFVYRPVSRMVEHSRAFQKIQDGCDYRCAYCAVPYGRGNSRSARFADVIDQAQLFVANGYKEIVLGGVNLGLYRDGKNGLAEVVEALQNIPGLELIRLSSLEPMLFDPDLLRRISQCSKLCPHFHLALQSGCDGVLKRMGRSYPSSMFRSLVENILSTLPDAAIGLDVIAGFPSETAAEFQTTLDLISDLEVTYLHAFSFSRRPGTPAYTMPGQVTKEEKNRRVTLLHELSDHKKQLYTEKLLQTGIHLRGIFESVADGLATCLSDHYIRAYADFATEPGGILRGKPVLRHADGVLMSSEPS